jgi:tetratricopeptide (TPR) repeat protein
LRLILVVALLVILNPAPISEQIKQWWNSGNASVQADDYDRALAMFDRILGSTSSKSGVYERLVDLNLAAQRYDEAQMYLYALVDLEGWDARRRDQLSLILVQGDQTDLATVLLSSGSHEYSNPQALSLLAGHQIDQLDWAQAKVTLEQLVALEPENTQALFQLGLLLAPEDQAAAAGYLERAAGDPELRAAVDTIKAALDRYANLPLADAHAYLGITLVGLSQWPFAEMVLEQALMVNAVNPMALAYLGFVRDQQGRDGLPDLEAALAMAPGDPTIYFLMGQHWRLAEDHEAAYNMFIEAYRLDPDNPALAAEVGTTLQLSGELSEAETWLRTAIDLAPVDPRWYGLLAAFYADTGYELETTGLSFVEEAAQLVPQDSDIHASLGWVYYQLGDFAKAYEQLNIAVTLDPQHPRSRYYFAIMLEYLGDREGAIESYRFVVQALGSETGFGLLAARSLERLGS